MTSHGQTAEAILYLQHHDWHLWQPGHEDIELGEQPAMAADVAMPAVGTVVLPLERLLVRPFRLPLEQPRLVDEAILAQEIEDLTGEEAASWWLAWQACKADQEGVAGLVLGTPTVWLEALQQLPALQAARTVTADAVIRLHRWLPDVPAAVVDADAEGVFFGYWKNGCWHGVRRVNFHGRDAGDVGEEMMASLEAMGWQPDEPVYGRLPDGLVACLPGGCWQGETVAGRELPARWSETLAALRPGNGYPLNFRHGKWKPRNGAGNRRQWRRIGALAAVVLLAWLGGQGALMLRLQHQAEVYRQQILDAFRSALPNEPVIDPLAQLRRLGTAGGQHGVRILQDLAAISRVFSDQPWTVKEIRFANGRFEMRGETRSLDRLNDLQQELQQALGRNVEIADTDLAEGRVAFRMVWS